MRQWLYKYTLRKELWSKLMQIIFMYTVYRSEGTDNLYIIRKKLQKHFWSELYVTGQILSPRHRVVVSAH